MILGRTTFCFVSLKNNLCTAQIFTINNKFSINSTHCRINGKKRFSQVILLHFARQRKSKLGFKRQLRICNAMFFSLDSPCIPHILMLHWTTSWIKKISQKHFTMLKICFVEGNENE